MIGRPHQIFAGEIFTEDSAHRFIDSFDLFDDAQNCGWVTTNGEFYGCNYASHERVLYALNVRTKDVEVAGWVRVIHGGTKYHPYRLTSRQKKKMNEMGFFCEEQGRNLPPENYPLMEYDSGD